MIALPSAAMDRGWLIARPCESSELVSLRKLTREGLLWYLVFPLGVLAALLVFGGLTASGPVFLSVLVPVFLAGSFALVPAFWWMNHFGKLVSRRATDLSIYSLFVSVLIDVTRYALAIDNGILASILDGVAGVCFVAGFLGGFYYLLIGNDRIVTGQRLIITGWLSLIYVYFGSRSAHNIASEIFHLDLLTPQLWLWIGRVGLQAALILVALGLLSIRPATPLPLGEYEEPSKLSRGERLRRISPWVTMLGVFLSSAPITVLGGLIIVIVGVLLYPIGRIVTALTRQKASG